MDPMATAGPEAGPVFPWQLPLWTQFGEACRRDRMAHAYLLAGPLGVGKRILARRIAASVLCRSPLPDDGACGRCTDCLLLEAGTHPDLAVVEPESGKTQIAIEAVRALCADLTQTAHQGGMRVALIVPAEAMTPQSANSLLKTLEEPHGRVLLILISDRPLAVLPTLRSRCQSVVLPRPDREAALAWLQAQGLQDAAIVLDACGGEPLRALEQAREGRDAEAWRRFPAQVMQGDSAALAGWPLPVLVEALQRLCEDRLRQALGLAPQSFPLLEAPRGALPVDRLIATLTETAAWLRARARHADHPWSAPLAVEALVQRTRAALAARPQPA